MTEINLPMDSTPSQPEVTVSGKVTPVQKEHLGLLLLSLFLGFLFNLLFYDKVLGLSYPLYVIAVYAVLFWLLRQEQPLKFDWTWLWGIPVLALSFSYLFFTNQLFAVLNFLMVPVLLVAHTVLMASRNRYQWFSPLFLVDIVLGMIVRPLAHCLKPFPLLSKALKNRYHLGKAAVVFQVLAGLLAAVLLFIVIVPLLAAADDVFRHYVALLPNVFLGLNIGEFIFRMIIMIIVACLSFSYLWSLLVTRTVFNGVGAGQGERKALAFLNPVAVTAFLVLIDLLYVFFIAIQFSYLFGSLQYGLPQDFTYAEYARKGFFELLAVTLINLVVLLGNMNFVKASGSRADKAVKLLNTVLVIGTMLMLLSAHFRMSLYEEAYGLTYLRVLTHAFMGYLLVLFVATLSKIWVLKLGLLKSFIVISLLAYTLLNYLNIDRLIAENNIARYQQGNPIDILYLTTLSYEVVPQLVNFMQNTSERELAEKLEKGLTSKKQALEKEIPWQSFNLSRDRARKILFTIK